MQDSFIFSGKRSDENTLFSLILLFQLSDFSFANQGGATGPSTLALGASLRFVYRELTERVITVIVIFFDQVHQRRKKEKHMICIFLKV